MNTATDEPAVLTWMIALAPRPHYSTGGRHWWRELVTQTYRAARDARSALRESSHPVYSVAGTANSGAAAYQLSDAEFDEAFPAPRFGDVLHAMSTGAIEPYGEPR